MYCICYIHLEILLYVYTASNVNFLFNKGFFLLLLLLLWWLLLKYNGGWGKEINFKSKFTYNRKQCVVVRFYVRVRCGSYKQQQQRQQQQQQQNLNYDSRKNETQQSSYLFTVPNIIIIITLWRTHLHIKPFSLIVVGLVTLYEFPFKCEKQIPVLRTSHR